MISPLLSEAVEDAQLDGAPIRVLFYLHTVLDYGEFRTVKAWYVGERLRITRRHVTRALKRLTDLGYLRMRKTKEQNVGMYMLLASRETAEHHAPKRKTA